MLKDLSGNQRLLLVGAAVAIVAYYGLPYFRGELGSAVHQLRSAFPQQMVDPRGLLSRGEGDYEDAPPGRGQRIPGGFGYAGGGGGGGDPRDRQGRPYRRWRECTSGRHQTCGPWQDGPAPGDGGGRW